MNEEMKDTPVTEEVTAQEEMQESTPIAEENSLAAEETPAAPVEIIGIRFKQGGKTYYFAPNGITAKLGDMAIAETARGVELGKVTIANREVPAADIVAPLRPILRLATQKDLEHAEENRKLEERAFSVCREKIRRHNLEMSLVAVESTFDNSKLFFYFTAENRVDFRELVRDLASTFVKTRIDLRQIGIRDEAKMMGGFGVCGRPFCCSTFLSDFVQVSIKMAKEQNFSLNSAKISGACGRLMCCLRYEHESYEEALRVTPSVGSQVSTPNGVGIVVEARPLAGVVKVRLDEKNEAPRLYPCEDVRVLRGKGGIKAENTPEPESPAPEVSESVAETPSAPAEQPKREDAQRGDRNRRNGRNHHHNRNETSHERNAEARVESAPESGSETGEPKQNHHQGNRPHHRPHRGGRGRRRGGHGGNRGPANTPNNT